MVIASGMLVLAVALLLFIVLATVLGKKADDPFQQAVLNLLVLNIIATLFVGGMVIIQLHPN